MKKKLFILIYLFNIFILYSQSGWVIQAPGTNEPFSGVDFVNTNTGFVISVTGKILKTTNSGINWFIIYNSPGSYLNDIDFTNEQTGYVAGGLGFNVILKTTNSGDTWTTQYTGLNNDLYCVSFINDLTGFAAGEQLIIRTTNGGINWVSLSTGNNSFYYSIFALNGEMAFACGYQGVILKTINGGINWELQFLPIEFPEKIYFADYNTGYVAGSQGSFYKTTNGGVNWSNKSLSTGYYFSTIYFTSADTGYASADYNFGSGQGLCYLLKTINGGNEWNIQFSDDSDLVLHDFKFTNILTGYVIGTRGTILKTTTGGVIGIKKKGDKIPEHFILSQNYPNPFNPKTTIKLALPKSTFAKLAIYDILGREVATLVNEKLSPGTYEVEWNASNYPSGVYFYKLESDNYSETKRMVLIK